MSVMFQNMIGEAGEKFNGQIIQLVDPVDIISGNRICGYFTSLPISDKEYRKDHKTKAAISVKKWFDKTILVIFDDWGNTHTIQIDNDDPALQKTLAFFESGNIPNLLEKE